MYYEISYMEDKIMELIKENITVNQVCSKGCVKTSVDEDIIVPDVKPDILKVLQLDASACVTAKNVSDGKATASGRTDLKILYIPESDSENIKSIVTSFDFSQNIDSGDINAGMKALISANVENAEFTLINSRKLRIKVTVALDYEIVNENSIEIAVDAEQSDDAEILKETVSLQNCIGISESEFCLSENIEIPAGQTAINEILKADASITDTEYKTVIGKIIAKGAANASVLYTDEENKIRFMEAEIPFTEVFELEDAGDETICDIEYVVTDINARAKEDSDGDRRVICLDITVCAQIKATENVEVNMISDCYEPYMKTGLEKEAAELEEIVSRPSTQNTIRETVETEGDSAGVAGIYDVITRPYVTNAELQNGRLLAEGKIESCVLCLTDNEESPVCSVKKEIPFSCTMNAGADDAENLVPEIKAEVKHTAYNLNMAGEIELRCVLHVGANIVRKRKIELISDVVTEERDENDRRGIVIYFVQSGDTLWEIAKRYAVPRSEILSFNNLTDDDALPTGARLLIPNM